MPEIAENDVYTQVVQFEVDPSKQAALISAIVAEAERWVCRRPGFISSTLHASLDGRAVINYAQWRSEADFQGFADDPEAARLRDAIRAVGPVSGPQAVRCRVVRSIVAAD